MHMPMLLLGNAYCLKLEFLCYDLQHEILVLRSHTFKYKVWILIAFGIKKKVEDLPENLV